MGVNARVFGLAATIGLAVSGRVLSGVATTFIMLCGLAALAIVLERRKPAQTWLSIVEGALVATTIAATGSGSPLYAYLVVPALMAGLRGGPSILAATVVAELAATVALPLLRFTPSMVPTVMQDVLPWLLTAIGFGLFGARTRRLSDRSPVQDHEQYVNAHELLGKLRIVSRRLSSGLDPVALAEKLLDESLRSVPQGSGRILVRAEDGGFTSLAQQPLRATLAPTTEASLLRCWSSADVVSIPSMVPNLWLMPIKAGPRMVGVLALELPGALAPGRLLYLKEVLGEGAIPLETALLFDDVRRLATVEERQRLAREIHDGVAQEIASLGYLVDDLAFAPDATRPLQVAQLRGQLTRIVDDLRLSIFDLRSQVGRATSLGSILGDYLREFGARSGTAVHFSLDEAPERLRLHVEEELLRIVQEAVTNARKHSGARQLWVACRVHPPGVDLTVEDDGSGVGADARPDGFGLSIMRERAQRIGATLEVSQRAGGGTCVTVRLPFSDAPPGPTASAGAPHARLLTRRRSAEVVRHA